MPFDVSSSGGLEINEIISSLTASGKSPDEILDALSSVEIDWYLAEKGDLFIKTWQIGAEDFVTPEQAAEIRANQENMENSNELDWLSMNLDQLRRDYSNQWVAIFNNEVIESASNLNELINLLPENNRPLITFIPPEPIVWNFAYANEIL
jgi:hypothetical protein